VGKAHVNALFLTFLKHESCRAGTSRTTPGQPAVFGVAVHDQFGNPVSGAAASSSVSTIVSQATLHSQDDWLRTLQGSAQQFHVSQMQLDSGIMSVSLRSNITGAFQVHTQPVMTTSQF
jgi:hypothetical protein